MYREDTASLWERYNEIFKSDEKKAEAFDKLARNYYLGNFGSMQKSDIDVLMFSLFIDCILEQSEDDINTYSDYTLAKQLGITQSRVSNLKQKKQLQYPYTGFDWKVSFKRCCGNAKADGDKIKINLRDINLYYEIQNQIDKHGGYVDATLSRNLLVITPDEFFELVEQILTEEEKSTLKKQIRKQYADNKTFIEELEREPLSKAVIGQVKDNLPAFLMNVLSGIVINAASPGLGILNAAITAFIRSGNSK